MGESACAGSNGSARGEGHGLDLEAVQRHLIPFPSPELADLIERNMKSLRAEILAGVERGISPSLSSKIAGGEERVALFLEALSATLRSGDPEPFLAYQAEQVEDYAREGVSLAEVEALMDCVREGLMRALLESAATPDQLLSLSIGSRILEKFIDATSAMTARRFILARERELNVKEAQLERLAQRLLAAQEEERKRIGQDIHDELIQLLFGLRYQVEVVARKLARGVGVEGDLAVVKNRIDRGLSELRRILRNLRPAVLDDLGLVPALHLLARQLRETVGLSADLIVDENMMRLPPEVETCLYRVAQESLVNVVKHADASHVEMSLGMVEETVVLRVRDDGGGFEGGAISARGYEGDYRVEGVCEVGEDAMGSEGSEVANEDTEDAGDQDEAARAGNGNAARDGDTGETGSCGLPGGAAVPLDVERARESFGLYGMRERVRALGGRLYVDSELGMGTTITAEIPVRPSAWGEE
ncbi:MAG: sensor histidine kinase [Actinobacteria bacterium]|nr:sensor histidine kinase [Actinomycetota bacterium]